MIDLKIAIYGTECWSLVQIPAWFKVGGVQLITLYHRMASKAEELVQQYNVPHVYGNP